MERDHGFLGGSSGISRRILILAMWVGAFSALGVSGALAQTPGISNDSSSEVMSEVGPVQNEQLMCE
ncbi:hypothetical protein ACFL34_00300 [Candidatus Sumerlaeota bacterium]